MTVQQKKYIHEVNGSMPSKLSFKPRLVFFFLLLTSLFANITYSEDWPHWLGPTRDNRWSCPNALTKFPDGGPKSVWKVPVAGGYSGPAVVGNRLYLTDYVTHDQVRTDNFSRAEFTGKERVLCLDANDGKIIWKHEYPVTYSISYPAGPRCTPAVDGEFVYTLGAEGHLWCFQRETGKIIWSHSLKDKYRTKSAIWGYASHPLIDGEKLICLVGGEGTHTVAFHKTTGEELWRYGTATEQGYSPPVIIQAANTRQLILMSPNWIAAVDPENGKEFWTEQYNANNGSIIMMPVHSDKYLFVGGFAKRTLMLELDSQKPAAKVLWRDAAKKGFSPVNVQPFLDGDIMYGFHETGEFAAVQIPSGQRLWETTQPLGKRPLNSATAFLVKNEDVFYLFAETGELILGKIDAQGFREIDRAKILEPTNSAFGRSVVWCQPAFANGRMYVRNDEECVCIELTDRDD